MSHTQQTLPPLLRRVQLLRCRNKGRGRRLRAANQLRVNRTALPFSHPHVTPQSQSLPSNRFVCFTL
ncbi:hypothetical protein J6590_088691 [Homalodisca vitripennis]|nr:hypothetical protein J6590_088691 [Homalodisca vitripennis]